MSKKPALLVIVTALGLAAPALAAPTAATKAKVGEKFVVGHKEDRLALTQAQVADVMKAKLGEVTTCWQQLPADKRKKDASAVLQLEIDEGGEVQTVDVAGLPDDAARCISKAAVAWVFPPTDGSADTAKFAYPVTLRAN
jgi:hypothetical protein